jgi:hypothetical protein
MLGAAEATNTTPTPDHTDSTRIIEDVQANLGPARAKAAHEEGTRLDPDAASQASRVVPRG